LVAADISALALERAACRCHGLRNILFQNFDFVRDPIPGEFDLIVCSEVLYYLGTVERLRATIQKLLEALAPDGVIILAHPNLVSDDPDQTGFDWPKHTFGVKTIGEVVSDLGGLTLERELRTPLYRVQRFRRGAAGTTADLPPSVMDLPLITPLSRRVERGVVWGGAIVTREAAFRFERTSALPILMYHRIAESGPKGLSPYRTHPKDFEEQVRWLRRRGYYSVSIDQWSNAMQTNTPLPGRPVLFTFDDGYGDFAEVAWPILDRHGFSALVFVVTGKVGGFADWDVSYGEPAPLMGWRDIRQLARSGVEFGSHTRFHKRLSCLTTDEVLEECTNSRLLLERELERRISAFSYPWGAHNPDVCRMVSKAGYRMGLTTRPMLSRLTDDPFALPRLEVLGNFRLRDFATLLDEGRLTVASS
jgi:peptidoglycan/xylan/chitin deacetylase (PgdA/CDA1 family)